MKANDIVQKFADNSNSNREGLAELFAELGYKTGVEIGVSEGGFSETLLKSNSNLKLYSIDPWSAYGNISQRLQESFLRAARRRLLPYNVEIVRKTSMDALADFPDNSLDFVYIDGLHDQDNVYKDIVCWSNKVRPGGIVSGHDYIRKRGVGVIEAVDLYVKQNNVNLHLTKGDKLTSFFWLKPGEEGKDKAFSFFTKGTSNAAVIRAKQIMWPLGGKYKPSEGYEDDICIFVKCFPEMNEIPRKTYIDVLDHLPAARWAKSHPNVKLIAASRISQELISQVCRRRDIIFLPQHHCNFGRKSRTRNDVTTVGIIGAHSSFVFDVDKLSKGLEGIGMNLLCLKRRFGRRSVVDFYSKIDVQIVFRPHKVNALVEKMLTSLKLVNAGSFGIPTIAYPEEAFIDEFGGAFAPAYTEEELIVGVKKLKEEKNFYDDLSNASKNISEKYHIEHIAYLYKQLLD